MFVHVEGLNISAVLMSPTAVMHSPQVSPPNKNAPMGFQMMDQVTTANLYWPVGAVSCRLRLLMPLNRY